MATLSYEAQEENLKMTTLVFKNRYSHLGNIEKSQKALGSEPNYVQEASSKSLRTKRGLYLFFQWLQMQDDFLKNDEVRTGRKTV